MERFDGEIGAVEAAVSRPLRSSISSSPATASPKATDLGLARPGL